jgi:hypothetical protein
MLDLENERLSSGGKFPPNAGTDADGVAEGPAP